MPLRMIYVILRRSCGTELGTKDEIETCLDDRLKRARQTKKTFTFRNEAKHKKTFKSEDEEDEEEEGSKAVKPSTVFDVGALNEP
jgi:hypothetical protein